MAAPRVFVTHSSSDIAIVEQIVHLLETSMRLPSGDIRCTSLPGYRLEGGARTPDAIRRDIEGAEFVLGVLSKGGERSDWVRFELGAAWALRRRLIPILVDIGYEDLPEPIRERNAFRAAAENDMLQLVDEIAASLHAEKNPTPRTLEAARRVTSAATRGQEPNPQPVRNETLVARPPAAELDEESIRFLKAFVVDEADAPEAGAPLGISPPKAQYLADKLKDIDYLDEIWIVGEEPRYSLSKKGRAYLIERGHIQ